jgi:Zn ribbon nucleic-acid-binding protein
MGKTQNTMFESVAMCPYCMGHDTMGNYKGRPSFHKCLTCGKVFMAKGAISASVLARMRKNGD